VNHVKISKSLNNFVDPVEIGKKYSVDFVKYFLLRQSNLTQDSDFNESDLQFHVNELSNNLGNLVKRTFALKLHNGEDHEISCKNLKESDEVLIELVENLSKKIIKFYDSYDFRQGILTIMELLKEANAYFEREKTYKCRGERLSSIKYIIAEILRISSIGLYPILPEKMTELLQYIDHDVEQNCLASEMKFKRDSMFNIQFNPPLLFNKIMK
jgi:methionyl-tRNA synthetase